MDKGLEAAIRRFPLKVPDILRLALADGSFRALCDDLADAESALSQWAVSTAAQSERRRSEYRLLVSELAEEINQSLNAAQAG